MSHFPQLGSARCQITVVTIDYNLPTAPNDIQYYHDNHSRHAALEKLSQHILSDLPGNVPEVKGALGSIF